MIITTTNHIDNATVDQYLGVVTSHLVLGTNFISDVFAQFSDIFGGMSGTYREKMNLLYAEASEELKKEARKMGANAVLGVRIDFDEISGQGKSMFMIAISGTAVKISIKQVSEASPHESHAVSLRDYKIAEFIQNWDSSESSMPTDDQWNFIIKHNLTSLAKSIYKKYCYWVEHNLDGPGGASIKTNFPQFLGIVPREEVCDILYDDYLTHHKIAYSFIKDLKQYNGSKILGLLKADGDINTVISLLTTEKKEYASADIEIMDEIINYLQNLPDVRNYAEIKGGMFSSKTKQVYICQCGHKINEDETYCNACRCNIKGLRSTSVAIVENFKTRYQLLKQLQEEQTGSDLFKEQSEPRPRTSSFCL